MAKYYKKNQVVKKHPKKQQVEEPKPLIPWVKVNAILALVFGIAAIVYAIGGNGTVAWTYVGLCVAFAVFMILNYQRYNKK